MHNVAVLMAFYLVGSSALAAGVQLPGMEKVDHSCRHVSTCSGLPPHIKVKGDYCSYQAAVGFEEGTGQAIIALFVGDYDLSRKAATNVQLARKALLGNYDLSDVRNITAEPIKYGAISLTVDAIGKTGSFKYRGYIPGVGGSWVEVTGVQCE